MTERQPTSLLRILLIIVSISALVALGFSYYQYVYNPSYREESSSKIISNSSIKTLNTSNLSSNSNSIEQQTPSISSEDSTYKATNSSAELSTEILDNNLSNNTLQSNETLPSSEFVDASNPLENLDNSTDFSSNATLDVNAEDLLSASIEDENSSLEGTSTNNTSSLPIDDLPLASENPLIAEESDGASISTEELRDESSSSNTSSIIEFSKGHHINGDHSKVRGEISTTVYKPSEEAISKMEDPIVKTPFLVGMANYLVGSYWPTGTYPNYRSKEFSTATLSALNNNFGSSLTGIVENSSGNILISRKQFFKYISDSSISNKLYSIYNKRFMDAMVKAANSSQKHLGGRHLSKREQASLFDYYSKQLHGVSQGLMAYYNSSNIEQQIETILAMDEEVKKQSYDYLEYLNSSNKHFSAFSYQKTLLKKDQAINLMIAELRRNADTRNLDSNSLSYLAFWIYRRGVDFKEALPSISQNLAHCADLFASESKAIISN